MGCFAIRSSNAMPGLPVITKIEPALVMQYSTREIVVHGIYFQNTTSVTIGGRNCRLENNASLVNPVISPCWLQISRQEACDYETTKVSWLSVGDLIPCDRIASCVYWISAATTCPADTSTICYTHRCLYGNHNQCYGFLDTPDYSWCADGKACLGGQCVDARGEDCPSTVTCTFEAGMGLTPGLHDIEITSHNETFVFENQFRVMPQPLTVSWGIDGLPEYVSPGHLVAASITDFSDYSYYNHTVSLVVDNVEFDNGAAFPLLDTMDMDSDSKTLYIAVTFTDFSNISVVTDSSFPITYLQQPVIYSLCPSAILSFIEHEIVVQGEHFVNTSLLECYINNGIVPVTYISDRLVSCRVVSNDTVDSLNLQVSNDAYVKAPIPAVIQITGACDQLKPNSVAVKDECQCVAGFEDTGVACIPCSDGTYQSQIGQQACVPCDSTESTGGQTGSTSVAACQCKDGRFRADSGDISCALCAEGMICEDGMITVQEGYWRQSESDLFVVECPTGNIGCAGGAGAGNSVCKEGYEGPVCAVCSDGYGKIGSVCVKCQATGVNIFVMIILIFLALAMAVVLIRSTADRRHGAADFSTTIKIAVSYLQVLYYVGQLSADWSYLSDQFFASTVAASMSPSFLSMQCAMPMSFYNRITLTMLTPLFMCVIFAFPFLLVFCSRRALHTSSLNVLRDYGASVLIVLYIIHPPIALDVLGSLRCEDVPGTGTRYMRDDMRVDCESDSYKTYRIIAILYIAFYIIGVPVLVGWRIKVNRDELNAALTIRSLDEPIYIYFVRGYSKREYLWEGAVLARKLGIVMCNAFLSSGLQLVWGLIIIGISLGFTVLKQPYDRVFANRLDTYALIALVVTVVLGFHSLFTDSETDMTIFALLIIFNGFVMFALLAATVSKMKGPMQDFLKKVADFIGINDKASVRDVEMHDRKSLSIQSHSRQTTFSSINSTALPDTPRPTDDDKSEHGIFKFEDVPL